MTCINELTGLRDNAIKTRREWFEFWVSMRPTDGIIPLSKRLADICAIEFKDVVSALKEKNCVTYKTDSEVDAVRILGKLRSAKLEYYAFARVEVKEGRVLTDECSSTNMDCLSRYQNKEGEQ